jgi:hypothetical protein
MIVRSPKPKLNLTQRRRWRWTESLGLMLVLLPAGLLQAETLHVPNASFESPTVFFLVSTVFDSWERTPQSTNWDENVSGPWTNQTGIFKNTAVGSPDHIDNCDGLQAGWLFATPGVGLFQDYNSMDWDDPAPTHAFDSQYEVGKAYRLQVGLFVGTSVGLPMQEGVPLALSLYYRDAASNQVAVATTVVTNSSGVFSNGNHFLDFEVNVPTVQPGDAWAGENIGILFLSTVNPEQEGGYWDLDNVRLTSVSATAPRLSSPVYTNSQFQFTLVSDPGTTCEILASTNLALPVSAWTSLVTVTNVTGTIPLVDTNTDFDQRFYRARQVP